MSPHTLASPSDPPTKGDRLLGQATEQGHEYRHTRGGHPDPSQLAVQDAYASRREKSAQRDRRDVNGTPGQEIPLMVKGSEERHARATVRHGIGKRSGFRSGRLGSGPLPPHDPHMQGSARM